MFDYVLIAPRLTQIHASLSHHLSHAIIAALDLVDHNKPTFNATQDVSRRFKNGFREGTTATRKVKASASE